MPLPIDGTIQYACELIDIGKGIIPTLTEDNLLYIIKRQNFQGLQDVIQHDGLINQISPILVDPTGAIFVYGTESSNPNIHPVVFASGQTLSNTTAPLSIGYSDNQLTNILRGFSWYLNRTVFIDTMINKGIENGGDYENNFTARSLVTKQYVDPKQKILDIAIPGNFTSNNYTLVAADMNTFFILKNGATNVTITVPTGLSSQFFSTFIRQGTGEVTFVESSTTINSSIGKRIDLRYDQVALDKEGNTNTFYLTGNTKV